MKRIIYGGLFLVLTAPSFAQQTETAPAPPLTKADYLRKSKHQKTAAWILTGAGTMGLIGTAVADMSQVTGGIFVTIVTVGTVEPDYKSYAGYYLVSAACLGAGITYFIVAGKNKRKAKALSAYIKMESATALHSAGFSRRSYPSVAVKIRL